MSVHVDYCYSCEDVAYKSKIMLTESVSDPRRANWLTITSMCDDLCWPDEPSTSRPNWELEAEILRLTTRLMMRERELRQAKNQLKVQTSRAQQQANAWRQRMEEKEEQMKELLLQKDAEMQNIVSQLLLFEAELRREQSRIEDLLGEKDAQIHYQKLEIDRLKNSDSKNLPIHEDSGVSASGLRREQTRIEDFLDTRMQSKGVEINRLMSVDTKISNNPGDSGVSAAELRLEQSRFESSLDSRVHCKRIEIDRLKNSNTKTAKDNSAVVSAAELRREHSRIEELLDAKIHQYRRKETKRLKNSDSKTSNSSEDSGVVISSSDSCPSPSEMKDEFEKSNHFFQIHQDGVFEDPLAVYDSQLAVQKLKDGLVKIRAIQDVTNVKLDFSYDCVVNDKKRIPYRAPQKMKDLKAKRSINPHKSHRTFVTDVNNQVIL